MIIRRRIRRKQGGGGQGGANKEVPTTIVIECWMRGILFYIVAWGANLSDNESTSHVDH